LETLSRVLGSEKKHRDKYGLIKLPEPRTVEEAHARLKAARKRMETVRRRQLSVAPAAPQPAPEPAALDHSAVAYAPWYWDDLDGMAAPIRAKAIIRRIADETGYEYEDIIGPARFSALVKVRHRAIREVREMNRDWSLPQLAAAFNRDHTTILAVLRKQDPAWVAARREQQKAAHARRGRKGKRS
jgi:hypothetical protein